ncbi:transporter substrate-binding domain-containing protein [uncultured Halopseudomonas sp.]|uniref:substrate-binding periplasmic protein n=1 Tax=uncultured Halopseudomonas sp. TaxID=2901193 RepID=UPI0030ED948F|tara:strand:- start:1316 stop:2083 length:768 start_codon:yes stop_codon:yes gene_type:complete
MNVKALLDNPLGRSLFLGLTLALVTSYPRAEEPMRTLNAAFLHYPPLAYLDENGEAAGSVIDLTNSLAAQSGLKLDWKVYPIKRIYKGLRNGEIDIWPGSQAVPALSDATLETPSIGIEITLCAFSLEGTPLLDTLEDLSRSQLVLIRGYTYRAQLDDIFQNSVREPIVTPDHDSAMQLLEKGRADYLISYNDPIEHVLLDNPQPGSKCEAIDRWPLVYVISRQLFDAPDVAASLTKAYERVSHAEQKRSIALTQ